MSSRTKLLYIEDKTDGDHGPAWIARVRLSKTGRTVYFDGRALLQIGGSGIRGNHICSETRTEYWVSGVKKNGGDRHSCGGGVIYVEESALEEYLELRGWTALPRQGYAVVDDLAPPDIEGFHARQNEPLG